MSHSKTCAICGCPLHRNGEYARPTTQGRSHATSHHYVPERFFGRSKNRPGTQRARIFTCCPWGIERRSAVFCYECHEELIHNPVFLPEDIERLAELVHSRGLNEDYKPENLEKISARIKLLHEVISEGLTVLLSRQRPEETAGQ